MDGFFLRLQDFLIFGNRRNKLRQKATLWCERVALASSDEVLEKLFNKTGQYKFEDKFSDQISSSSEMQRSVPYSFGGAGNMNFVYWLVKFSKAKYVGESGVAYGWSTLAILLALKRSSRSASKY